MSSYAELISQRDELERKIQAALKAEKSTAIAKVKELVAQFELSADDIGFKAGKPAATKQRAAVAVKYRGPNGETWTGRGRTPAWVAALETQGKARDAYLVK